MPEQLPPDLSRLGEALARATARQARARRRRRERLGRAVAAGVAGALALAVLAPGQPQPAERAAAPLELASSSTVYRPVACDQPRGATFAAVRPCASPGSTDVEPALMSRHYAVQ